jgi:pyruvate kinase
MYEAGANSFLLNLAYTSIDQVQLLKDNRDRLEAEYGVPIPIICVLKGSIYRIGDMK